jgi:hypothetical protein
MNLMFLLVIFTLCSLGLWSPISVAYFGASLVMCGLSSLYLFTYRKQNEQLYKQAIIAACLMFSIMSVFRQILLNAF